MGTSVIFETAIQEKPVAVQTFFDATTKPYGPVIAVAAGGSIY